MASGVVFVHEDAGRAREIVGPAIAYQRTRYAEWGTDKDKPLQSRSARRICPGRDIWSARLRRSRKR